MASAGVWLRLKAFTLDYVWVFLYLCFVALVSLVLWPGLQDFFTGPIVIAQLTGFLIVTLPVSLYFAVGDSALVKGTFGKRKLMLRVVGLNEQPIGFPRSFLRTLIKFLPWEMSHFLIYRLIHVGEGEVPLHLMVVGALIYILMFTYGLTAKFSKEYRSLYDWLSGSKVVRV